MKKYKCILFNEDKTVVYFIKKEQFNAYRIIRYNMSNKKYIGWSDCTNEGYFELISDKYLSYEKYFSIISKYSTNLIFSSDSEEARIAKISFLKKLSKYEK